MPKYDSIIIGGGHNGLVTAAYLARSGRKVLVLERRELLGGCAVTEEIWPGYRVSTGAYLTSLMQERIVNDLELPRHGYQVDAKDPAFFSAFPDGRHFFMWQDRARTLAEIAKFSTRDAEVYPAYEDQLERISQVVEGLLLTTPPPFPPRAMDLVEYLRLMGKMRGLSTKDIVALVKVFTQSASEFLDEWFESEEVKVTLATDGVIGANGGPRSPGTLTFCFTIAWAASPTSRLGLCPRRHGRSVESIASAARAKGVEIRTNATVARILVRGGQPTASPKAAKRSRLLLWPRISIRSSLSFACWMPPACPRTSWRRSATSASRAPAARLTWRSMRSPNSPPILELPDRTTRRRCTSARASNTSSARGTMPSTGAPRRAHCSNSLSPPCTIPRWPRPANTS